MPILNTLPLGAFSIVETLPGVNTPVCGLSSLRDFRVSPLRLLFAKNADKKDLKGRGRNVPRTAIDIKQVMYSVALSGLSFVNALVPGVNTPVCGLSSLRDFRVS